MQATSKRYVPPSVLTTFKNPKLKLLGGVDERDVVLLPASVFDILPFSVRAEFSILEANAYAGLNTFRAAPFLVIVEFVWDRDQGQRPNEALCFRAKLNRPIDWLSGHRRIR